LAVVPVTVARQTGKHPNNLDHSSAVPCVNPSSDRNRGAKRFGRVAVGFDFPAFNAFSSAMFARYIDVGSAIANISAVPLRLPRALRVAAHSVIGAAPRRYERAYRELRPLDDRAVLYYEVFRAVAQLVSVGQARAAGRVGGGTFHSAAGVGNLIALIRKLSSVSLRLEKRA
jgi:hypothetical protein